MMEYVVFYSLNLRFKNEYAIPYPLQPLELLCLIAAHLRCMPCLDGASDSVLVSQRDWLRPNITQLSPVPNAKIAV